MKNKSNYTEYKVGQIVEWCSEKFEIIELFGDIATVKQGNDIIKNFKLNYGGEWAKILYIKCKTEHCLREVNRENNYCGICRGI